jgi:hypothetical protein
MLIIIYHKELDKPIFAKNPNIANVLVAAGDAISGLYVDTSGCLLDKP